MHHVIPKAIYFQVAGWLAALFVATVLAAQVNLGVWNVPLALAIAIAKATLIVLFFMQVRYGSPLVKLFATGGFLWLLILLTFLAADVLKR
jgi:cytochrome c oxidase subunit IV